MGRWRLLFLVSVVLLWINSLSSLVDATISGGYKLTSIGVIAEGRGLAASLQLTKNLIPTYGPDIQDLQLTIIYENEDRLRVHITDSSNLRWEIPTSLLPREINLSPLTLTPFSDAPARGVFAFGSSLEFSYTSDPFGFAVTRQSTGDVLFNSTPSYANEGSAIFNGLVFKDQYIEISTHLRNDSVLFGLGENTRAGLRLARGRNYTLWASDIGSNIPNIDLYGAYPFYIDLKNSLAHGVLLLNSNGMDISYEGNYLTYRVIGGVLDFYFFGGPSPKTVVDQFTQLVGRPAPMPYWSLGFHQCRWGYKNVGALEAVVAGYAEAEIPLEVMWSDIDYMDHYKDFTVDPVNYPEEKFRAFVDKLHANDQKYVLIVDPGIALGSNYTTFQHGQDLDVYVKNQYGDNYLGQVWPGPLYYPDFLHPNIYEFWGKEIKLFHRRIPFDGIWCDMNEASNFCAGPNCFLDLDIQCPLEDDGTACCLICNSSLPLSTWDDPPYKINILGYHASINTKTIALSSVHYGGVKEYDAHNLFGLSQAITTNKAMASLTGKRPFVLSRSTFVGSGSYVAHWTGDNGASFDDLKYSIAGVLNSGISGLPMVGADICGFQYDTWEELCIRWIQVGAFYPFSRNHADINSIAQELFLWDSVAETARKVLGLRYQLLPYYYTLLYEAHLTGTPVMRPLFFEFPNDPAAVEIDEQFMIGSGILVSPVVSADTTTVKAYIPHGTWYDIFNSSETLTVSDEGEFFDLPAPLNKINIHLREGFILPMQEKALTTSAARKTPFTLIVVFSSDVSSGNASGRLFLDNGEDIEMKVGQGKGSLIDFAAFKAVGHGVLRSSVTAGDYALREKFVVQTIRVLGLGFQPSKVTVNVDSIHPAVHVKANSEHSVDITHLALSLGTSFEISLGI